MRDRAPSGSGTPIRIAGSALVFVIGPGADRAVHAAFAQEEVLEPGGDPGPALAADRFVAVPLEHSDAALVRSLLGAAEEADRPVDAILLTAAAPADLPAASRFRTITVARGGPLTIERLPAAFDRRDLHGPFDVIGDVHGCLDELLLLLARLGYAVDLDAEGRPAGARSPHGRTAVFVGDLVDRGPEVPGVLRLVLGMLAAGDALSVAGNHDDALHRAMLGEDVPAGGGLDRSLEQLAREPAAFRDGVRDALGSLPAHLLLDHGRLVVAHARLPARFHGRESARVRALCLGGTQEDAGGAGRPVPPPRADGSRATSVVVHGHTRTAEPAWRDGALGIDTGCAFGGALTAVRYPELELVSVPAVAALPALP